MHSETYQASPKLVASLKLLLGSQYALYTKVWGFHWNLVGTDFAERHVLYGEWKDMLGDGVDVLAERIRQLDGTAMGSMVEMAKMSVIEEIPGALMDEATTATLLCADFCTMCSAYYKAIEVAEAEDKVTSNILQDLSFKTDKVKWFLKSITH